MMAVFLLRFPRSEHGQLIFMSVWWYIKSLGKRLLGRHEEVDEVVVGLWGSIMHIPILEERRGGQCLGCAQGACPWSSLGGREWLCPSPLCLITMGVEWWGQSSQITTGILLPLRRVVAEWQLLKTSFLGKLYQTPLCKGCCYDFKTGIYPGAMRQSINNCNCTISV